jgi:uroporphyrin-III C-methyltransferase/precorrin-2 dehydrogenase/sirohydrochlorin ferrochelatase
VPRLLAAGVESDRPASAIFNATRPQEHVVNGTLATISDRVAASEVSGPCLLIVGSVLRSRADLAAGAAGADAA